MGNRFPVTSPNSISATPGIPSGRWCQNRRYRPIPQIMASPEELLTILYKREDQYRDALAKAAELCVLGDAPRPDLRDAIRGLAKTYGMVRLIARPEEMWTPEKVMAEVLGILRRTPDMIFAPGDLRTSVDPTPTLSVWQDAIRLLVEHPKVRSFGGGGTRRYQWITASERAAAAIA